MCLREKTMGTRPCILHASEELGVILKCILCYISLNFYTKVIFIKNRCSKNENFLITESESFARNLIDNGADIHALNDDGETPLFLAASQSIITRLFIK